MRTRRSVEMRRGIAAFLLAAAFALCPSPGSGQVNDPEVKSVRFDGIAAFQERALELAIVTRETDCPLWVCWWFFPEDVAYLNRRELPRDLARIKIFYFQRGFREAQVDTSVVELDSTQVEVVFHVVEGTPVVVDSIGFGGADSLPLDELTRDLPLQVGEPLSILDMDASRDSLVSRLRNNGFAHAEVLRGYFIPASDPYTAQVSFDFYPGNFAHFGSVEVEGATELSPTVVRRMLPFQEGDPYSQASVFQGQRNLFGLELIRHANLRAELESEPDTIVPVRVEVAEGDVNRLRGGGEWNTAECLGLEARWTNRNFRGGGRRLQLTGRVSNIGAKTVRDYLCYQAGTGDFSDLNWLASVEFAQPWVFSSKNALTGAVYAERTSVPEIFIRKAVGFNVGWVRTLGNRGILTTSYRPQRVALEAAQVYFCSAFLICEPEAIAELQEPNRLSPIGLNYQLDRTDAPLNPTRGYLASADYEIAGPVTLSDFSYQRVAGSFSAYRRVSPGIVLASRIRGGLVMPGVFRLSDPGEGAVEEIVHPEKRFFSGGANSVRGFGQNQLGDRNLTTGVERLITAPPETAAVCTPEQIIDLTCDATPLGDNGFDRPVPVGGTLVAEANLEARIRAWGSSQIALFLDVGQVWNQAGDFSLGDLEATPGVGFRLLTPIGPVRLDVGYQFRNSTALPVITDQIRPLTPEDDPDQLRVIESPDERQWVVTETLALLDPPVLYPTENGGELPRFSLRRFQFHFTIGQAF
jgi:outer membrane protein assembly factor BamA